MKNKKNIGLMGHISRIGLIKDRRGWWKTVTALLVVFALLSGIYFAITRAYTPGDTSGVKKVMPPPYSDPALAGYWSMDDNAASTTVTDLSGNGNNGTAQTNTNTKSTTNAVHNRALTFNGTSDYVSVADSVIWDSYPITVSAWVKTSAATQNGGIVSHYNTYDGWILWLWNGKISLFFYKDSDNSAVHTCTNAFGLNAWHHVVGVVNASGASIYIDGVLEGTTAWVGIPQAPSTAQSLLIGKVTAYPIDGSIDDVRIYSKALTASDVYALYQAGRPRTQGGGFSKMLFPPIDQSVVGWWKLNDNAANTTVKDWSSGGNTGTSVANTNTKSVAGYTGVANTAMSFNGTTDYVNAPVIGLPLGSSARTVTAWFKTTSVPNNHNTIFAYGTGAPGKPIYLLDLRSTGKVYFESGSGADAIYSAASKADGNWHFAALTYDSDKVRMYVDGVLEATTNSATLATGSSAFQVGNMPWDPQHKYTGSISDVRIYNRALSANEVRGLYMKGR